MICFFPSVEIFSPVKCSDLVEKFGTVIYYPPQKKIVQCLIITHILNFSTSYHDIVKKKS